MSKEATPHLERPYRRVWEWREDDAEPYWVVRLAEIPRSWATAARDRRLRRRSASASPITSGIAKPRG